MTWLLNLLVMKILRTDKMGVTSREDELRGLIDLHSQDTDADGRETGAMLSSVLDLGEISVEEIMTHRASVSAVNADDDPEEILRFVLKSPHTRHPVYSGKPENIIGVLHVKALLRAIEENSARDITGLSVADIATEPYFIPETTQLFAQLQAFRKRREHFAIVIDEYGDLRGIVTLEDILEEIVGEIDDEHDEGLLEVKLQSDGSYIVDGSVTLRDLNRILDLELPDDKASLPWQGLSFMKAAIFRLLARNSAFTGCVFASATVLEISLPLSAYGAMIALRIPPLEYWPF